MKPGKVNVAWFTTAVLDCPIGAEARFKAWSCSKLLALSSVSKSSLRFLRTQDRGIFGDWIWPDPQLKGKQRLLLGVLVTL